MIVKKVLTVLLAMVIVAVSITAFLSVRNKKNNNVTNNQELAISEQEDLNKITTDLNKDIVADSKNDETPIKKSETENLSSQKEADLKKVENELKITPNNELLKSRRDVLLKDWIADPSQDTPKE